MIWKVLAYFLKNIKILYITFILFCKVGLRDSKSTDRVTVLLAASAAAKSFQSCPPLCEPRDGSPPGSPVARILQARTLEWVAISFSKAWMWKVKVKSLSHVPLFATPWTAAYQAPPSMGFSRQEYWSGVPLPSPKAPYDPAISLLDIYLEETETDKDTCITLFIAALFTIPRTWKQPRCPLTDE